MKHRMLKNKTQEDNVKCRNKQENAREYVSKKREES